MNTAHHSGTYGFFITGLLRRVKTTVKYVSFRILRYGEGETDGIGLCITAGQAIVGAEWGDAITERGSKGMDRGGDGEARQGTDAGDVSAGVGPS